MKESLHNKGGSQLELGKEKLKAVPRLKGYSSGVAPDGKKKGKKGGGGKDRYPEEEGLLERASPWAIEGGMIIS